MEAPAVRPLSPPEKDSRSPASKELRSAKRLTCRPGEESESDFESDPPSPKSSEDEDVEEDEALNSEHGEDTEPENFGQRPLLMDSEDDGEEDEDEEDDRRRTKNFSKKPRSSGGGPQAALITPPESPGRVGAAAPVDAFGAVPFLRGAPPPETADIFGKAPFRQVGHDDERPADEFDVFTKAPFGRNLSKTPGQTPPLSPEAVDVFGFSPFQPPPAASRSAEDIFCSSLSESASPQQQRLKQRSLQKLSSRQRRAKQEHGAVVGGSGNGKRHHGTPTGGRKGGKPMFRTPERVRRHKKAGRRDSQSSNEFLNNASDSKENISVDVTMAEGDEKGATLQGDEAPLDQFGAKPFHPQHHSESWSGSLQSRSMDDFGAVPFTELVVHGGSQQAPPGDLDPFGAAPFPSKQ
ncbi:unnamed protein product [Ophioblennius macclurei]